MNKFIVKITKEKKKAYTAIWQILQNWFSITCLCFVLSKLFWGEIRLLSVASSPGLIAVTVTIKVKVSIYKTTNIDVIMNEYGVFNDKLNDPINIRPK